MEKTITITNETGIHTRPGNKFVTLAKSFESKILVKNEETKKEVKGTSLLKLLSLGIKKNTKITLTTTGNDEAKAMNELSELLLNLKD